MFYEHIEGDSLFNTLADEGWECEDDLESEIRNAGYQQDKSFTSNSFDTFWYDGVKSINSRWVNDYGDVVYIIEVEE
jgi:hypothetical protein